MSRIIDTQLPDNIFGFFSKTTMTGIASTVDSDGFPRGAPMSLYCAPSRQYLLMALQNQSGTFNNLAQNGRVALTFVGTGDIAFTIKGKAQVMKHHMEGSQAVGVVVITVLEVKSDVAIDVKVARGIKTEFRSPQWKEFVNKLLEELRAYTIQDIEKFMAGLD